MYNFIVTISCFVQDDSVSSLIFTQDWYRSEAPEADHQGYYHTSLPVILYEMLQQNVSQLYTKLQFQVTNVY